MTPEKILENIRINSQSDCAAVDSNRSYLWRSFIAALIVFLAVLLEPFSEQAQATSSTEIKFLSAPLSESPAFEPPTEYGDVVGAENVLVFNTAKEEGGHFPCFQCLIISVRKIIGSTQPLSLHLTAKDHFVVIQSLLSRENIFAWDFCTDCLPRVPLQIGQAVSKANTKLLNLSRRFSVVDHVESNLQRMARLAGERLANVRELNAVGMNNHKNMSALCSGESVSGFLCGIGGDTGSFVGSVKKQALSSGHKEKKSREKLQSVSVIGYPIISRFRFYIGGALIGIVYGLLLWRWENKENGAKDECR